MGWLHLVRFCVVFAELVRCCEPGQAWYTSQRPGSVPINIRILQLNFASLLKCETISISFHRDKVLKQYFIPESNAKCCYSEQALVLDTSDGGEKLFRVVLRSARVRNSADVFNVPVI